MNRSALLTSILLLGLAGCGNVITYEETFVAVKAPDDDEALRKWLEEQPGVRDVLVTREEKTVRVRYSRHGAHWEFNDLAPPRKDLGYEASAFHWKITGSARLIPGVPDWVVFIVAIVAGTVAIEGIRWFLRRRKTDEPKAAADGSRDPGVS